MLVRRTGRVEVLLTITMRAATLLILVISSFGGVQCSTKPYGGVLQSAISYSPLPHKPEYKSNATFNPLGMEHVYKITNTFLSIIQRRDMMPIGIRFALSLELNYIVRFNLFCFRFKHLNGCGGDLCWTRTLPCLLIITLAAAASPGFTSFESI